MNTCVTKDSSFVLGGFRRGRDSNPYLLAEVIHVLRLLD